MPNETVDIGSLFDSDPADRKPCRAQRRRGAKAQINKADLQPKAFINGGVEGTNSLDSGATTEISSRINL